MAPSSSLSTFLSVWIAADGLDLLHPLILANSNNSTGEPDPLVALEETQHFFPFFSLLQPLPPFFLPSPPLLSSSFLVSLCLTLGLHAFQASTLSLSYNPSFLLTLLLRKVTHQVAEAGLKSCGNIPSL